jgi:host factor-I protein
MSKPQPRGIPKLLLKRTRVRPSSFDDKNKGTILVASEKSQNVQDVFLNHVRKSKTPVTVFLVNGVKLQGVITWFDNFSVLLRRDGHTQLVYKHAISTVMPGAPIQLFDAAKVEGGASAGAGAAPASTGSNTLKLGPRADAATQDAATQDADS